MNQNNSTAGHDTRSIMRIIFEKANFGAPPVEFSLNGIEGWHPVQWTQHPKLAAVRFADGSVVWIDAKESNTPIDPIAKGGDNEPWDYPDVIQQTEKGTTGRAPTYADVFTTNLQDSNLMQDAEDALADLAMVDVVLTAGRAEPQIRGAFSGVIGETPGGEVDLVEESEVIPEPEAVTEEKADDSDKPAEKAPPHFDAILRNVHRDGADRLHGFISGDKGDRFVDGSWVTTSKIESVEDDIFLTTSGTRYKVVSWVKDQSLGARLAVAQNINESNVES